MTLQGLEIDDRLRSVLIVGDFGSGKTEVAVNLALGLAARAGGRPVAIADLDLVNPYFRTREARAPLERAGIRVVVPPGDQEFADLPILLPSVKGLLQDQGTLSVLDVGGDATGARVLASLAPQIQAAPHQFWFVVNGRRPFCDTAAGVMAAMERIELTTGLRTTGLVANTHLMDETTPELVLGGVRLAEEVATERGIPVALVAVMDWIADRLPQGGRALGYPLLRMTRIMTPPWIRRGTEKLGPLAFRHGPA